MPELGHEISTIPMLHMSAVAAVMDTLIEIGTPLSPGLSASKMPSHVVEERNGYVPFGAACNWIDGEARNQGIDNIGLRAGLRAGAGVLPLSMRNKIIAAPTMYQGICTWADIVQRESTHVKIWIDDSGKDLQLLFSSTFAQDVPGQSDWIWVADALHMAVAGLFLGPDWRPPKMFVPAYGINLDLARELLPDTQLLRHPRITGLTIPRHLLARPAAQSAQPNGADAVIPEPPDSLEASLIELIKFYLPHGPLRIEEAASAAGFSLRAFQRLLAEKGLNYREVSSNLRFNEACTLLNETDMSIADIANQLGYRYSTHFSRAFRRIAGMSPRQYRQRDL